MLILFLIIMLIIFLLPYSSEIIKYIKDSVEHRKYLKQFENIDEKYDIEPVPKKKGISGALAVVLMLALFIVGLAIGSSKSDSSEKSYVMNTVDAEKSITDDGVNEQTNSKSLPDGDASKSNKSSYIKNGEGYSFSAVGWKLLDSGEDYDFDILMNIPYIQKGIISVQIKHFYLSETLFDGKSPDFDTYVNYDYELSKLIFSLGGEDIQFSDSIEKSRRIGNSYAYEYYMDHKADIISLDLSQAKYGTDEYGNVIITNIDSLSTVTYYNVLCRSKYYFAENGDEVIEITVTYTIENEDKCKWYIDDFLDGITFEEIT